MLRLTLRQARPGMLLARAIPAAGSTDADFFPRAHRLTAADIATLHHHGLYDLWATTPELDFLETLLTPALTPAQRRVLDALTQGFHAQLARTLGSSLLRVYAQSLAEVTATILRLVPALPVINDPALTPDTLLRHGAEVALLSLLLGGHLANYLATERKRPPTTITRDLVTLAVGAFFHDLGETQLPEPNRESRRPADDGDPTPHGPWRHHVDLGYTLLKPHLEPATAAIVLNHHQHFDGSGFPVTLSGRPQSGHAIHIFSRIVAVADAFTHLHVRDQMPMPTVHALMRTQFTHRTRFDPVILDALIALVPPFPPGSLVRLNDGRDALVLAHQPAAPCCPKVLPLTLDGPGDALDLSQPGQPIIQYADGMDVMNDLYGPRTPNFTPNRAVA